MSAFEPGRCRAARAAKRQSLEQPAHSVRLGEAACRLDQGGCACGRLGPRQAIGALKQAEAGEEDALRNRPVDRRAGVTRGGGERGEIDMGGQVGGAGGASGSAGWPSRSAWRLSPGALCSGP